MAWVDLTSERFGPTDREAEKVDGVLMATADDAAASSLLSFPWFIATTDAAFSSSSLLIDNRASISAGERCSFDEDNEKGCSSVSVGGALEVPALTLLPSLINGITRGLPGDNGFAR